MSTALIFPGQGSQYVGMGKCLSENFRESKEIFQRVDEALQENLSKLIWHGSEAELKLTQNTQPALMAMSMAAIAAAKAEGFNLNDVTYVAGHSLGEYSALCFANGLELEDAAKILRRRGLAMQDAVPQGLGGMAAIIGLDINKVHETLASLSSGEVCEVANDNDPRQVVISGNLEKVKEAMLKLKDTGARRTILLPVSAPFHCSLMGPAAAQMEEFIMNLKVSPITIPLVSNVTAEEVLITSDIKSLLVKQITHSVRWRESMLYLSTCKVNNFIEFGAGKVLGGLIKRILPQASILNVGDTKDIKNLMEVKLV